MNLLTENSKHLVVGLGEVGQALLRVLQEKYRVQGVDKQVEVEPWLEYDVLHICFPYSDKFVAAVERYRTGYLLPGGLIVIHSTLPLGVTRQIENAVHSPIRGIHPNLAEGIKKFMKFFGGERSVEAAKIFDDLGIQTCATKVPEETEAMKLFDTLQYGINIFLEKEIHAFCEKYGLDFDLVYRLANTTYNDGYYHLHRPEFTKYVLQHKPGKVAGHCIMENAKMLDTDFAKFLLEKNSKL